MSEQQVERVRPFSSGSQFADWTGCNCDRCDKGVHRQSLEGWPTCEIEIALYDAYVDDGGVAIEIANRMGHTEHKGNYVWPCNEVVWTEEWKTECQKRSEAKQ